MKRGIAYRREVRNKQITRKKRILHFQSYYDPLYPKDGYLDKGKIHCSCWLCRRKSYDCPKMQDVRNKLKMDFSEFEYNSNN